MRSGDTTLSTSSRRKCSYNLCFDQFLPFECLLLLLSPCKKFESILHPFHIGIHDPENRFTSVTIFAFNLFKKPVFRKQTHVSFKVLDKIIFLYISPWVFDHSCFFNSVKILVGVTLFLAVIK